MAPPLDERFVFRLFESLEFDNDADVVVVVVVVVFLATGFLAELLLVLVAVPSIFEGGRNERRLRTLSELMEADVSAAAAETAAVLAATNAFVSSAGGASSSTSIGCGVARTSGVLAAAFRLVLVDAAVTAVVVVVAAAVVPCSSSLSSTKPACTARGDAPLRVAGTGVLVSRCNVADWTVGGVGLTTCVGGTARHDEPAERGCD